MSRSGGQARGGVKVGIMFRGQGLGVKVGVKVVVKSRSGSRSGVKVGVMIDGHKVGGQCQGVNVRGRGQGQGKGGSRSGGWGQMVGRDYWMRLEINREWFFQETHDRIPFHSIPFHSNPFQSIPFHSMFYPMPDLLAKILLITGFRGTPLTPSCPAYCNVKTQINKTHREKFE